MKRLFKYGLIILLSTSWAANAQDVDSLLMKDDLDFLISGDSASIFSLMDSLLKSDAGTSSQLALRLSYNSNVLAAGRTLGIENFGLAPGLTYFHASGLSADVAGFWSNDFDPNYYLTIASLGYSRIFNKYFSVMGGYDRYFYSAADDNTYIPYRNSASVTPIVDIKKFSISTTYSYFFGDKQVHRIMPSLSITVQRKKLLGIDRVAVLPSITMLLGNETFTKIETLYPKTIREALENIRNYGTRYRLEEKITQSFGVMNYAFSIPVSISHKKLSFLFIYTYNIPKALPGETLLLEESSFISASLAYTIDLSRK
jgi:hypothetical protein